MFVDLDKVHKIHVGLVDIFYLSNTILSLWMFVGMVKYEEKWCIMQMKLTVNFLILIYSSV